MGPTHREREREREAILIRPAAEQTEWPPDGRRPLTRTAARRIKRERERERERERRAYFILDSVNDGGRESESEIIPPGSKGGERTCRLGARVNTDSECKRYDTSLASAHCERAREGGSERNPLCIPT